MNARTKLAYRVRHDCRLCRSQRIECVLPLAPMPVATPNFRLAGLSRDDALFREPVPLDLYLCHDCGMLQVNHVIDAHIQFDNYVYTTSLSVGLTQHFQRYADDVVSALKPASGSLVVEIGSNDGTLLNFFKQKGLRVRGCDPAKLIAARATERGIPTIADFFGQAASRRIRSEDGRATIVIANNVIANIDDLDDLVDGVRELVADDGVFVFETQYGLDVLLNNLLDTVYHEHLSYFNVRPLQLYLRAHGLELFDVAHVSTKGGSVRVFAQKASGSRRVAASVDAFVRRESEAGAYGRELFAKLRTRITAVRDQLHDEVARARRQARKVAGYGVSVGTTTLLAQFALGGEVDMLFDDDPNKDPVLAGPGYDIPVYGPAALPDFDPAVLIIFAWRYADAILAKHKAWLANGRRALVPLPDVRTIGG